MSYSHESPDDADLAARLRASSLSPRRSATLKHIEFVARDGCVSDHNRTPSSRPPERRSSRDAARIRCFVAAGVEVVIHESSGDRYDIVLGSGDSRPDTSTLPTELLPVLQFAEDEPVFRESFKWRPRETLERLWNVSLPCQLELAVHENTPAVWHIVLGQLRCGEPDELTDLELEWVSAARGTSWTYRRPRFT